MDKDSRTLWRFELNHRWCWRTSWNGSSRRRSSGRGTGPGAWTSQGTTWKETVLICDCGKPRTDILPQPTKFWLASRTRRYRKVWKQDALMLRTSFWLKCEWQMGSRRYTSDLHIVTIDTLLFAWLWRQGLYSGKRNLSVVCCQLASSFQCLLQITGQPGAT